MWFSHLAVESFVISSYFRQVYHPFLYISLISDCFPNVLLCCVRWSLTEGFLVITLSRALRVTTNPGFNLTGLLTVPKWAGWKRARDESGEQLNVCRQCSKRTVAFVTTSEYIYIYPRARVIAVITNDIKWYRCVFRTDGRESRDHDMKDLLVSHLRENERGRERETEGTNTRTHALVKWVSI